jgi:hydroxyacylglutathione hydrolase
MKNLFKIVLLILGIIFGLIFIVEISISLNFSRASKVMMPSETGAINDSVWCIRDRFVNAYIFKGKTGYIMFDAGIGKKNFNIELNKLGIKTKKITAILLTHSYGDHIGAISLFKNATIYIYQNEEQMVNGKNGKTKFTKIRWKYGPYTLLKNYDTLNIDGLNVKILATPDHTPGSSCYLIGHDYLVSGDNFFVKNGKYEHFSDRFNMNTPEQIESIKDLPAPETFKFILTGHYGVTKN